MSYALNEDFAAGLDLRKSAVTAKAGGLRQLKNAFVNAGGEVERRKKFGLLATVPTTTTGLAGVDNKIYVFGVVSPGAVSVAPPIYYQQLIPSPALGDGVVIDRILDCEVFLTSLYTVARFTDGSVRHFYGSTQIATPQGPAAMAFRNKMYAVNGSVVRFSAIGVASDWAGTGSGLIDVTAQDTGSADLIGLAPYYNYLCLFGRRSIQLWSMSSDPAQNQFVQTLSGTGLVGSNAAVRYGSGDVLFLSDTGIRSVRARDSSNAAVLNDVGSPIDNLIQPRRLTMSSTDADRVKALTDPLSGHCWFVWGSNVYVLAYYPQSKITAWSVFETALAIDYATVAGNRVVIRQGDGIYLYGDGSSPSTALETFTPGLIPALEYDNSEVVIETPFLDFGKPATEKTFMGIDVACTGVWIVEVNTDPTAPNTAWETVATLDKTTYSLERIGFASTSTHIAVRATNTTAGPAKFAAVAIHYEGGDSD